MLPLTDNTESSQSGLHFSDGNIALLAGDSYFLVHQGFLSRHSNPIATAITELLERPSSPVTYDGKLILQVADSPEEIRHFLLALYDGISELKFNAKTFDLVSTLMNLSSKYQVAHLRKDLLVGLSKAWPQTLAQWDVREALATNSSGLYEPRRVIPHPILVINLARANQADELLPSAFYDLCRCSPSRTILGYRTPSAPGSFRLSSEDLLALLRGREHASRFLSTFIVNHLEGRAPAMTCIYHNHPDLTLRRTCQAAFEGITFELLRDANGMVYHRSSDPLFAILDSYRLLSKSTGQPSACSSCLAEFQVVVEAARDDFWSLLPTWFSVPVASWS